MNLEKLYSDPSVPGSLGRFHKAYREFKTVIPNLKKKDLEEWSKTSLAYSLHKPSRKNFRGERVLTNIIDYLWKCDLVDKMYFVYVDMCLFLMFLLDHWLEHHQNQ